LNHRCLYLHVVSPEFKVNVFVCVCLDRNGQPSQVPVTDNVNKHSVFCAVAFTGDYCSCLTFLSLAELSETMQFIALHCEPNSKAQNGLQLLLSKIVNMHAVYVWHNQRTNMIVGYSENRLK